MKGLLIYDTEGARRNAWFIDRLTESSKALGNELELFIYDGENMPKVAIDFAIVRTIAPALNEYFEKLGTPAFNNYKTSRIANDKWETYLFAKEHGIPVMDTVKADSYDEVTKACGSPFVLKAVDGHGGSEVFLVDSVVKYKELLSSLSYERVIAQRTCDEVGVDMRVYLLGGKVLAAAKRTSESDFRSNFSLGGKAEIVAVPDEVEKILSTVYEALECDFVGVDFIRHSGRWILNEIEDAVGTRMLYSLTELDAAKLYIEYIFDKLR